MTLLDHLIVLPILLPLVASALMLFLNERRWRLKRSLSIGVAAILVANAAGLLLRLGPAGEPGGILVYLLGDWPAPFGIVLVADRLAAMMLLLASILGFAALVYATARWDRAAPRFHPLFLLLLMGVNGAFLTGDIFNLFVFFEVLLAASYGLTMHGSSASRTLASLHYIAINVAASLLFLIGIALIYSVTGTLNLADLAMRIPEVAAQDRMLLLGGAAVLGVAFLVKAAIWPLCFWLPYVYSAAVPPVAAVFVILSKVGIYALLRLNTLLFGADAGSMAGFADPWLLIGGLATIAFGTAGIMSTRLLQRVASYYILVSSGILLSAIAVGGADLVSSALFYLVSSSLAVSALFLFVEPVERAGAGSADPQPVMADPVFADDYLASQKEETEVGLVIPGTIAILGAGFAFCALLLSGMPPLTGFLAKFMVIDGVLRAAETLTWTHWTLIALIWLSGMAALVVMTRAGIELLWTPSEYPPVPLRAVEVAPIGLLLAACLVLMLGAFPVKLYMDDVARTLHQPRVYIDAVKLAPHTARPGTAP